MMQTATAEFKVVARKPGFTQVCVWPATVVGKDKIAEFEQYIFDETATRVQYLEEIETFPSRTDDGDYVLGTGGRNDVFFAIHNDDIGKFAVPRFKFGIRWFDDVVSGINGGNKLYPDRVMQYRTWSPDTLANKG